MNRIMNSHYRAKDDLFLNIIDELEVFIPLKLLVVNSSEC